MKYNSEDILVHFGGAIKAIDGAEEGLIGGYLVTYTDATKKDLTGEFFTKSTYFGPHGGDGMNTMLHHGKPLHPALAPLAAEKKFALPPMKVTPDEIGLFASVVLDLSDAYHKQVYDLAVKGALAWSSGSAPHMATVLETGEIKSWPIIEGSLTPTPCSPELTNKVLPLKSLLEIDMSDTTTTAPAETPAASTPNEPVKAVYFSEWLEGDITMSALQSLWWELNGKGWNAVTSVENQTMTVADAAAMLQPILAEFSEMFIKIFVSLMAMKETMAAEGDAFAIKSIAEQHQDGDAFVDALKSNFLKASKVLSAKNVERATSIIKAAQEMLDDHNAKGAKEEDATKSETPAATETTWVAATKSDEPVQSEILATLKAIAAALATKSEPAVAAPTTEAPAAETAATTSTEAATTSENDSTETTAETAEDTTTSTVGEWTEELHQELISSI